MLVVLCTCFIVIYYVFSAIFVNNTADTGAALYIDQGSVAYINNGNTVQFINNSATEHGGAIFVMYLILVHYLFLLIPIL